MNLLLLILASAGPGEDQSAGSLLLPASLAESEAPQDPPPLPGQYRRRLNEMDARSSKVDGWAAYAREPLAAPRAGVWHGLLHTPPLEDAGLIQAKAWRLRAWLDVVTSDWSSDEGGGRGRFEAVSITQTLAVDYAFTDLFQVGVRLTTGELKAGDDEIIRVYEGGTQQVSTGERGFGVKSAVLRLKHAYPTSWAYLAAAVEVKLPLGNEEDLLTAQTIDIGVTGIATKRWGPVSASLNIGIVLPLGDPEIFAENDEADPYLQGGISVAWQMHDRFVALAQIAFNSSAYSEIGALDAPVATGMVGGRLRLLPRLFAHAGIGAGFTEASGDLFFTAGLDAQF
jgi:hypothetical protein